MATTYYSDQITGNYPARMLHAGNFEVWATFTLTAAFVINDVVQMVKVQNGDRVLNIELYTDDLDTNGSPTITLDIGDGDTAARFASAVTVAQSGGFMRGIQTKAGFGYQYTADDTIDIKVNAAPTTGATSGDIKMRVTLCRDN